MCGRLEGYVAETESKQWLRDERVQSGGAEREREWVSEGASEMRVEQ